MYKLASYTYTTWAQFRVFQLLTITLASSNHIDCLLLLQKNYFLGKFALLRQSSQGVRRRLVHFTLGDQFDPDQDLWPWGGEPIYRDGVFVGNITSSA